MAKILIHTLGSSGDFNPFMALAIELRQRGHTIHFALSPAFTEKAQALGFSASVAGQDPDWDSEMMRRMLKMHRTDPIRTLFEEVLIPAIVPATETLEPLVREADLFLSHTIQLAAPAVAERTGTPWISASAATLIYETHTYPPPSVAWKGCPAVLSQLGWQVGLKMFGGLDELAAVEYRRLGVAPRPNVLSGGAYSRRLTLGLWSPSFFPRPSDWPFCFRSEATPVGMAAIQPLRLPYYWGLGGQGRASFLRLAPPWSITQASSGRQRWVRLRRRIGTQYYLVLPKITQYRRIFGTVCKS